MSSDVLDPPRMSDNFLSLLLGSDLQSQLKTDRSNSWIVVHQFELWEPCFFLFCHFLAERLVHSTCKSPTWKEVLYKTLWKPDTTACKNNWIGDSFPLIWSWKNKAGVALVCHVPEFLQDWRKKVKRSWLCHVQLSLLHQIRFFSTRFRSVQKWKRMQNSANTKSNHKMTNHKPLIAPAWNSD